MTIYNLGSINRDVFYRVPHLPKPGETLAAVSMSEGLGGKGANQSVAAALSGASVRHIGAVGVDGDWAIYELAAKGVETALIEKKDVPTAHAIINVDPNAENSIVIYSGANNEISEASVKAALSSADSTDTLMLQNETNGQVKAARLAHEKGMRVIYSAAPFDAERVAEVMPFVSVLVMNEVERDQLCLALRVSETDIDVPELIVTKGANGVTWRARDKLVTQDAFPVTAVDTTGAGDTFIGYFAGLRDSGIDTQQDCLRWASAAASLMVTRHGTVSAIPKRAEVVEFLAQHH